MRKAGEAAEAGGERNLTSASCLSTQDFLIPPTDWGACIAYRQRKTVRRG